MLCDFSIDGRWTHVTTTWNRETSEVKLYLNGTVKDKKSSPVENPNIVPKNPGNVHFLGSNDSLKASLNGYLSDFAVLSIALEDHLVKKLKGK